jgi:predicted KAP-like P-loop ATPase
VREVMRLVRLTAQFPNLIFVLAFDRKRVEKALAPDDDDGREYLEKIVQLAVDLPPADEQLLQNLLTQSLGQALVALGDYENELDSRWADVLIDIILPLLRNPRDVKR